MNNINELSSRLKMIRQAKNLTQSELADKSGISQSQISTIENGDCNVRLNTLAALANALKISIADFFIQYSDEVDTSVVSKDYDINFAAANLWDEYEVYRSYYPPTLYDSKISNLLEFIIYLPLIDPKFIYDALCRIDGDINHNELYISKKLQDILCFIPDSPAKKYADYLYDTIQKRKKAHKTDIFIDQISHEDEYNAYSKLLKDKQDFYNKIMEIRTIEEELSPTSVSYNRWIKR